ncbi:MAG: hypothetical protein BWY76_01969 [bacterium ADurb.Bin429]|nr:MAG: hypothetical protein BWY76_01969 [bacterium ADurb.Bin429]
MAAWRRRPMLLLWLALFFYLALSGMVSMHVHRDLQCRTSHHSTIAVSPLVCALCAWHALAIPLPLLIVVAVVIVIAILAFMHPDARATKSVAICSLARAPPQQVLARLRSSI